MDDMMEKIQEVLSDPESMGQIQQLAQMFGLGGGQSAPPAPQNQPPPPPPSQPAGNTNMPDMSALLSMLQSQPSPQPQAQNPPPTGGSGVDLSGMMSMLQGVLGGQSQSPSPQNSPAASGASGGSGFDIGSIMKLGQLMQSAQVDDKDTALLLAIKPHLSEERQPRVDKALKILKLISLFTVAKNSGLLNNLTL